MASVTYTGTCLRPSCTARVWPTMSGVTVLRRDHVLMTLRSPAAFIASTFSRRWSSMNGPFFKLLGMLDLPPCAARTTPADDELVARLALLAGAALGLAPRRHRVPATGALSFAAPERVVDRVHRDAARLRAASLPSVATGLADRDQAGLAVADRTDRRAAVDRYAPHLGRGQPQRCEHAFLGNELDGRARAPAQLGTAARLELDVVHRGSDRDVTQRQRVADADLAALAALHHGADLETLRGDDVALLAVEIVQERKARVAVGVVLDCRDLGRHRVLVAAEVDDAVALLVPAPAVPGGHATVRVAAAGLRLRLRERLLGLGLGDLDEVGRRLETAPRTRRLAFANGHRQLPKMSMRSSPAA